MNVVNSRKPRHCSTTPYELGAEGRTSSTFMLAAFGTGARLEISPRLTRPPPIADWPKVLEIARGAATGRDSRLACCMNRSDQPRCRLKESTGRSLTESGAKVSKHSTETGDVTAELQGGLANQTPPRRRTNRPRLTAACTRACASC